VGGHAGDFRSGVSGGSHSRQKKHTAAKILEVKDQMSLKDDTEEIRLCNIAKITDATIAGGHHVGTSPKLERMRPAELATQQQVRRRMVPCGQGVDMSHSRNPD